MSGDLCEELIFEIFTRLPSKSLLRFRSLSKSLCSCIASPDFIRMHTSRSPQKVLFKHSSYKKKHCPEGVSWSYKYTLHSEDQLPLCPERGYIGITAVECPYSASTWSVGSCNGILCMFDTKKYSIILWNPSIRRELTLPNSPTSRCLGCYCEFDRVGFGYDPVTDDYMIVTLPIYGGTGESSYVYTMKTGAWCEISSPTPSYHKVKLGGRCFNGALHWVVRRSYEEEYCFIMTFSLSTYAFGIIELPEPSWEREQLLTITTIKGSLAVMSSLKVDSWNWVEYNNTASWPVFYKSIAYYKHRLLLHRVLELTSNGNLLLSTCSGHHVYVYDANIGTLSRLRNLDGNYEISDFKPCVESLQLLDIGTPQGSQLDTGEQKPNQSKKNHNNPKLKN